MKNSKKIYKKINTVLEKIILCAFIISIVSFVGFFVSTIGSLNMCLQSIY